MYFSREAIALLGWRGMLSTIISTAQNDKTSSQQHFYVVTHRKDPIMQKIRTRLSESHLSLSWRLLVTALALLLVAGSGLIASASVKASTDGCTNLVANGDMETSTGWNASTNGTYSLFSDYLVHSGAQAAYLAGVDNAVDNLSTGLLALPADQSVELSFWWQLQTEETSSGWDGLTVLVADAAGNPLRVLLTLSDANASAVWQQAKLDLSEYAGQSVQIQFKAQTDGSLATDFFIDDLSVTACSSVNAANQIFLPALHR